MRTLDESMHVTTLPLVSSPVMGYSRVEAQLRQLKPRVKNLSPEGEGRSTTGGIFCPRPLHNVSRNHKSPTQNFVSFVNLPPPFPPSPLLDHSSTLQWIFKQNLFNHLYSCLFAQPKLRHMENDHVAKRNPAFRSQTVMYCLTGIRNHATPVDYLPQIRNPIVCRRLDPPGDHMGVSSLL